MSDQHAVTPDVTRERTRAVTAAAVALVGATGGGAVAAGLGWLSVIGLPKLFEGDFLAQILFQGATPIGFGAAALWLAAGRSTDPVAAPAAVVARVLGVLALVGGALAVLAALLERF